MNTRNGNDEKRRALGPGLAADERGTALVMVLLFLVLLTALGFSAIATSNTEMMIAKNQRLNKLALAHATAGLHSIMARMDLVGTGNALAIGYNMRLTAVDSGGYSDSTWSVSSSDISIPHVAGTPDIVFSGTVKYKKEDSYHWRGKKDGYSASIPPKVVGYSGDAEYSDAPIYSWKNSFPVYTATVTGKVLDNSGNELATATVVSDITRNTLNVYADGGFQSNSCVTINGTGNTITGNGETAPDGSPIPAIITGGTGCSDQADMEAAAGGGTNITYNTSYDPNSFLGYDLDELKGFASQIYTYSNQDSELNRVYGDEATDDSEIVYYEYNGPPVTEPPDDVRNNVTLNNCHGYGVLIVDGDLKIQGTFDWKGLVYVTGNATLGGGGNEVKNIEGAIMAAGGLDSTIGGNLHVTYDSQMLENVAQAGFKSKMLNWRVNYAY
jgi:hypothetical protein